MNQAKASGGQLNPQQRAGGQKPQQGEHARSPKEQGVIEALAGDAADPNNAREAELRLLRALWRENVGALTGTLTHDFCNLTTGLVGLTEAIEASLAPDHPLRPSLRLLRQSAFDATQLAHCLERLRQSAPGEKTWVDLNHVLVELAELFQRTLPRRIAIKTELAEGEFPLETDAVALRQVIVKLALNAADAMPKGGELMFRTERHLESLPLSAVYGKRPKPPLGSVSVRDTGNGIAPDIRSRLFEPFVSSKPVGQGAGMGLYSIRRFAEEQDGAVSVESREGLGTTVRLWFEDRPAGEAHPGR